MPNYGDALLAIRTALLGAITPEMRGISLDQDEQKNIQIIFYHDDKMDQNTLRLWENARAKIHALLDSNYHVKIEIKRVDYPIPLNRANFYAYFKEEKPTRMRAILSLQKALLGHVTEALRAAIIKWSNDTNILYFYYDGEISQRDKDSVAKMAKEIENLYPKYNLSVEMHRLEYPQKIPLGGECVFKRYEKESRAGKLQEKSFHLH